MLYRWGNLQWTIQCCRAFVIERYLIMPRVAFGFGGGAATFLGLCDIGACPRGCNTVWLYCSSRCAFSVWRVQQRRCFLLSGKSYRMS